MADASDVTPMMEQLIEALRVEARSHAQLKPRLPGWAAAAIGGLAVSLVTMGITGLIAIGALQSDVTNLKNAHPESISSLTVKIDNVDRKIDDLQRRFNDFADRRESKR